MNDPNNKKNNIPALPVFRMRYLILIGVISLAVHLLSYISIGNYANNQRINFAHKKQAPVKIKIVEKKKEPKKKEEKKEDDKDPKQIVEAPLEKTEAPKEADYLGQQDHIAKKQTKIAKDKIKNTPGAKPGAQSEKSAQKNSVPNNELINKSGESSLPKNFTESVPKTKILTDPSSKVVVPVKKARNPYEQFLSNAFNNLENQVEQGYQDYIQGDIEEGDKIDLNTQSYRYIGYFSNLRRAIELVWIYPAAAARRGIQGVVNVEFKIEADGTVSRIKIIKSSNSDLLDEAIVQALKDASPFAPLPNTIEKKSLTVTGAFSYILGGYSAGH